LGRNLDKRLAEAASFLRLATSEHAHLDFVYESIRAARDILAEIWIDMEGNGEFPQAIVDRVMEIEENLEAAVRNRV